jgi:hypothetical protein
MYSKYCISLYSECVLAQQNFLKCHFYPTKKVQIQIRNTGSGNSSRQDANTDNIFL